MGNNEQIRKRMDTYRGILLAVVWIGAGIGVIAGFVMAGNRHIGGIGIGVALVSAVLGIIGHFMVNVLLAIPFILLNNGDMLVEIQEYLNESISLAKKVPYVRKASPGRSPSGDGQTAAEPAPAKAPPKPSPGATHTVLKETELKDSLSPAAKTCCLLKPGEKVTIAHINDRPDLGGKWARVYTATQQEGWCPLNALQVIANNLLN
ncbi:MAG: hypothetical protein MdMp014T_1036 [Treponematales bacterium]